MRGEEQMKLFDFQQETVERLKDQRGILIGHDHPLYGINQLLFWEKYTVPIGTSCWIWDASVTGNGLYGFYSWKVNKRNKASFSHRISYIIHNGLIPEGLVIDHLCRCHLCGNPDHLEAVTLKENQLRGLNCRLKTHCVNGHPYTDDNIYVDPSRGFRECRRCRYLAVLNYRENKRKAKANAN